MDRSRISCHESVRRQYERLKEDGMSTVWDRYEAQGLGDPDRRCPFCQGGTRCDLCSNGPCRADAAKDKRGVCGITADGMAMRMMLLRNVMGATTYQFHAEETLRETAKGTAQYTLRDPQKLRGFAARLGVDTGGSDADVALRLIGAVEADCRRREGHSAIVERLAPPERKDLWKELGIFPAGIYHEVVLATGSGLTSVDGYQVSLAKKAMRLSIAMAYQSQIVLEYLQDALFGVPRPHPMRVDLGVLDPDYVNVLPNGHEPFLGFALVDPARRPEWQEKAKAAGAKGLRIIANIETGQEMIQRWPMDYVFYGYPGNWITQEAVLATGCVDVFAADMNCSLPLDPRYAEKYRFRLVPVSEPVAFEGIAGRIDYDPAKAADQAARLLHQPAGPRPGRAQRCRGGGADPARHPGALDGLRECRDAGWRALRSRSKRAGGGGPRGVLHGSRDPTGAHGTCTDTGRCAALLYAISEALGGVPVPDLPVVAAAPEYMEQKATIDAIFALALLPTHANPVPTASGAPGVIHLLTEGLKGMTGGALLVEGDAAAAADAMLAHIEAKRKNLGI